ncbi:MAG: VacJ family lipoprotein [Alphaproteobacteria bacterium]|nr:VacJ family lipoprotein [Alphaproteobacteria bacterium]
MDIRPSSWRLVTGATVAAFFGLLSAGAAADGATAPHVFSRARFHQELGSATAPRDTVRAESPASGTDAVAAPSPDGRWARIMASIERRTLIQMRARQMQAGLRKEASSQDEASGMDVLPHIDDPIETINRAIHDANQIVTDKILDPVADYYQAHASPSVQDGMRNVFANLREPITVGSSLLQGSLADAGTSSARFAINSTVGLLGYYDQADSLGFPPVVRTLDEVLCTYGVPSGPYVVMPFFGPSSARDTAGRVATMLAQYMVLGPFIIPYRITDTASQHAEVRERMKYVDILAPDPYDSQKALYSKVQVLPCDAQTKFARRLFAR